MKIGYQIKNQGIEIKDLDSESRKVAGYFASFNTLDSDRDIIRKGAFSKSIAERGVESSSNRKIQHLRNHNWDLQIGKILELKEDDTGLYFVSQLGRSTAGNDAFLDYQDDIIKEHSIGFEYISDKMEYNAEQNYYEIKEVKLWEGSAVTFGANEFTPVVDVAKGLDKNYHIDKLNEEMYNIIKALNNGKGTDERLHSLEMKLKVITQKYNSLINHEPHCTKCTRKEDKPNEDDKKKELLIKLITKK